MPTQDYMVIHARQDHSLRVPRPDLSASLGSPNACTQCHKDKQPAWAANAMDSWYGKAWRERQSYGPTLHAGTTQGASALPKLLELARNQTAPAIIRATAATLAQPHANPGTLQAAREMLQDPDPSVRIAALGMVAPMDPVSTPGDPPCAASPPSANRTPPGSRCRRCPCCRPAGIREFPGTRGRLALGQRQSG